MITAYGSQARGRRDDHQEVLARLLKPAGQLGTRQATAQPSFTREIPRLQNTPSVAGSLTAGTGFQLRDQLRRSRRKVVDGPDALLAGRKPA